MCGDYLYSGFIENFIKHKEGRVYQTPFAFLILFFLFVFFLNAFAAPVFFIDELIICCISYAFV